jgi:catechol 2,3-dioxygenase-like lactoylglutathione lyase family enzyme
MSLAPTGGLVDMSIKDLKVGPVIPVSDLDASVAFYENVLGLSGEGVPGGYALRCGGDTRIYLLVAQDYPGRAAWPLASFETDDLDAVVADLRRRDVTFEAIEEGPQKTDDRGIADLEGLRIAWIRDPDNQVLSFFEPERRSGAGRA